jgi:Ca2+/Na+ antiporter
MTHQEMDMPEASLLQPDQQTQPKRLTAKLVIIGTVVFILTVNLGLAILEGQGIIAQSTIDAVMLFLLAGIGIVSATIGGWQRKQGQVEMALTFYRAAVLCLFIAVVMALNYHRDKETEDFVRRVKVERQQIEQWQKR